MREASMTKETKLTKTRLAKLECEDCGQKVVRDEMNKENASDVTFTFNGTEYGLCVSCQVNRFDTTQGR
jgi:hypothetical protein